MAVETKHVLFTIGYEGLDIDEFVRILREAGVTHVADIRQRPTSRKPGFSMNALREALQAYDLNYSLWRHLGTPQEIRQRFKDDHDTGLLLREYGDYLDSQADQLQQLAELATAEAVALLCFEADYRDCHRSVTCQRLQGIVEFEVRHL